MEVKKQHGLNYVYTGTAKDPDGLLFDFTNEQDISLKIADDNRNFPKDLFFQTVIENFWVTS